MSSSSTSSLTIPLSPVLHRDIRSASKQFKRDKDHSSKWIEGKRPLSGVRRICTYPTPSGDDPKWTKDSTSEKVKMRPRKRWSQILPSYKTHANKNPRTITHTWENGSAAHRVWRKIEAVTEANSSPDISLSMLEMVPQDVPNISTRIQTVTCTPSNEGILHPFEYSGVNPTKKGLVIGLGSLIDEAEAKFLDKQTELMIKEDYEVIDTEGESVVLKSEKKRKGSPKQKAKTETKPVEEFEGFELI